MHWKKLSSFISTSDEHTGVQEEGVCKGLQLNGNWEFNQHFIFSKKMSKRLNFKNTQSHKYIHIYMYTEMYLVNEKLILESKM